MREFNYQNKGETVESLYAISVEKGSLRYKAKLGSDLWFTITPLDIPGPDNKILWHQSNKDGEPILPHDLVQAVGDGIEALQ
jgi:hypothetical protein